jgi:hypothetical protein
MKANGGVDVLSHIGIHWIEVWVDPRAGLDVLEKKKILEPTGTQTPTPRSSSR